LLFTDPLQISTKEEHEAFRLQRSVSIQENDSPGWCVLDEKAQARLKEHACLVSTHQA
jgi:hypothetical protein